MTASGSASRTRETLLDAAAIAFVHALACFAVRAAGFDHVSDDDFARVTIAQSFAHAPRLDPSGTSWLPFPFWTLGAALAVLGRSLAVARAASVATASLALTTPYLALRATGTPRTRAIVATAFAALTPWAIWLGAATVPESTTASLAAAAAIALGARPLADGAATRALFAAAMVAACLSRYETWPLAAVVALALAASRRGSALALGALVAAGPLAWMAWNLHAHGDALHFFHRVARYKRAIGAGATDLGAALLLYPRLLVTTRPDVVVAGVGALPLLRRADVRARWLVPLVGALAQLVFLAYGNARDGAPAHHPERALLGTTMLLALFAADSLLSAAALARGAKSRLVVAAIVAIAWAATLRDLFGAPPGASEAEDRHAQVRRGLALRGARHLAITPCAYEHFALLAAFEAPERADVAKRIGPPGVDECPRVDVEW